MRPGRAEDRLRHQGVPDPQPYRRRTGRNRRQPREHERGRLALAHVRHGEGRRLARRPGRHRIYVPQRRAGGDRAGTFRHAVLAHARGHDLPAALRRPHEELGREPGAARLRRRRPDRPRAAAHALPAEPAPLGRVLCRIFRPRPRHGAGGRLPGRRRLEPRRRHDPLLPREAGDPGDRRLRALLFLLHLGPYLHGRRQRHDCARGPAEPGHGVRAVPPDGDSTAPAASSPRARAARAAT